MPDAPPPKPGDLVPPAGDSSHGSGGGAEGSSGGGASKKTGTGVDYYLLAPAGGSKLPCLIVYSGTEGGAAMAHNLSPMGFGSSVGITGWVIGVLDGVAYRGDAMAGADVLDELRKLYDVDNDKTYLLGESAGTTGALKLGFHLRQSYFAAYWANDVNARDTPGETADMLHFAPWGNAGPGGDFADADAIVGAMKAAGYRTMDPAPYDGKGYDMHGNLSQLVAALKFFPGKTRE